MLTPVSLAQANAFVAQHHRHHKPVVGHKFSIGCVADGQLVGVVIVGRPVSRYLDNGMTLEVNRLCTDGTKNACSFLYAAFCGTLSFFSLNTTFKRIGVTIVVITTVIITGPYRSCDIKPTAIPLLATIKATSPREIIPTPI